MSDNSGASTPNPRFTAHTRDGEDVLKEQTIGLVHLSDFRKRRAEALEQSEKQHYHGHSSQQSSRGGTPGATTEEDGRSVFSCVSTVAVPTDHDSVVWI